MTSKLFHNEVYEIKQLVCAHTPAKMWKKFYRICTVASNELDLVIICIFFQLQYVNFLFWNECISYYHTKVRALKIIIANCLVAILILLQMWAMSRV